MTDISTVVNEVVSELLDEKGYDHPQDLNSGDCPTVAKRITDRVPDADRVTGLMVFKGQNRRHYPAHTWVEYNDYHYDAECPTGTYYWHNLPIFRRGLPIDAKHVVDRYQTDQLDEDVW